MLLPYGKQRVTMPIIDLFNLILFLLTGGLVGLLAGLLGVGGGLVIVPILLYLLPQLGVGVSEVTHIAIGTSLATIIVTSLASVKTHHLQGTVVWPLFRVMAPGVVVGSILGSVVIRYIPSELLKNIFGSFVILIAVQMIIKFRPATNNKEPRKPSLFFAGSLIGSVSTLVGVGGGAISVPYLSFWNTEMVKAVGTSSALSLPLAIVGTIGFVILGWNSTTIPAGSLGYVYLPAFFWDRYRFQFYGIDWCKISEKNISKIALQTVCDLSHCRWT